MQCFQVFKEGKWIYYYIKNSKKPFTVNLLRYKFILRQNFKLFFTPNLIDVEYILNRTYKHIILLTTKKIPILNNFFQKFEFLCGHIFIYIFVSCYVYHTDKIIFYSVWMYVCCGVGILCRFSYKNCGPISTERRNKGKVLQILNQDSIQMKYLNPQNKQKCST